VAVRLARARTLEGRPEWSDDVIEAGAHNAITDVPGIAVGHATEAEALTGTTVILAGEGAVAGVDVRGAAPGSRETDLLAPENLVRLVQAVVLSGGSAFGLDSATGVMRFLEERGLGQRVGPNRVVPIVPAAVIFDLDIGSWSVRPTAEHGYLAARQASTGRPDQGNVGAGTGARAGGLKGGVGGASSIMASEAVVGAIAVVNSVGRAHDPITGDLFGRSLGLAGEFNLTGVPADRGYRGSPDDDYAALLPDDAPLAGRNTTVGVVATDVRLDKAQARKVAQMAHDGLARALRPSHTMFDGDTIFALSTGRRELAGPSELARLGAVAADTFARAIVHGMLSATSAGGLQCYRDAFPVDAGREA
jgi:L-aminopeptidase/D-esterase-like protein